MNLTEPIHPPFGVTQPRQLIRWEDVNGQGGKLSRTRGYLDLPAIPNNIGGTQPFFGYSEPILQYNCWVESNNFSLFLTTVPPNASTKPQKKHYSLFGWAAGQLPPNICWCVKDSTNQRYKLFGHIGETIDAPDYVGQMLQGPNIIIEGWCTPVGDMSIGPIAGVRVYTSILGTVDYRWGNDFPVGKPPYVFHNYFNQSNFDPVLGFDLPIMFVPDVVGYNQ